MLTEADFCERGFWPTSCFFLGGDGFNFSSLAFPDALVAPFFAAVFASALPFAAGDFFGATPAVLSALFVAAFVVGAFGLDGDFLAGAAFLIAALFGFTVFFADSFLGAETFFAAALTDLARAALGFDVDFAFVAPDLTDFFAAARAGFSAVFLRRDGALASLDFADLAFDFCAVFVAMIHSLGSRAGQVPDSYFFPIRRLLRRCDTTKASAALEQGATASGPVTRNSGVELEKEISRLFSGLVFVLNALA